MRIPTPKEFEMFKLKRECREDRQIRRQAKLVINDVCRELKKGKLSCFVSLGSADLCGEVGHIVSTQLEAAGWSVRIEPYTHNSHSITLSTEVLNDVT